MMAQDWVGKKIGDRYQIEALIGQGGMSAVYRAVDPNLRRVVAIKLIHPHLSVDPHFVDRFKEEAAAIARLRHPNIVQVYDFDRDGETYYMVMEYLAGETLQARLKRLNAAQRHLTVTEALKISAEICGAAGYAHKHGVIHRDIKPANIMLDVNGQAILMDFGIVKIVGGEYHTATGATVGTAMYMSPEQIRSERIDERSDIYSMGVMLYEMIGGHPPYQADSALTLMMMVLNDPLPDLRQLRHDVPPILVAVVEKALAKDRVERFQSAAEMEAALQQVRGQTDSAPAAATVVDKDEKEPGVLPVSSPRGVTLVEAFSSPGPEGRQAVAGQSGDQLSIQPAPTATRSDRPRAMIPLGISFRRWLMPAGGFLVLLAVAVGAFLWIASQRPPDLQLAPIGRPPAPITVQNAQAVVNLGEWRTKSTIEELAYSPDATLLATANNRDWEGWSQYRFYGSVWRVGEGKLQTYLLGHTQKVTGIAFAPDGQLVATASDDGALMVWRAIDGGRVRNMDAPIGGLAHVDVSPSGMLLAAGSWDGIVGLWQWSDGQLLRKLQAHKDSVRDVKFSPDGKMLASASSDGTIVLWRVSDGSPIQTLQGHTGQVYRVAFSPDGMLLASASEDHTVGVWRVSDGSRVRTLKGHREGVAAVAFSPEGSLLASGSWDTTVRLWRVADGQMLIVLAKHSDGVVGVAFARDSRLLVSGSADGEMQFWGMSEAIPLEGGPEPVSP